MNLVSEKYLEDLMEQGQESEVVTTCENCFSELYSGEEVVEDREGNYFCDEVCAGTYYGFDEIILYKY